jgi:hypothetical protein
MRCTSARLTWLAVIGFVLAAAPALAQSGDGYDLTLNTIDGGGGTFSSAGAFVLGGTVGQPEAGLVQTGGAYALRGGFWPAVVFGAPPTATPTNTTSLPTVTATHTVTRTAAVSPTVTHTQAPGTATATATRTPTPILSPTATNTGGAGTPTATEDSGTPTPTPTGLPVCVGDCSGNRMVAINELVIGVNILLGSQPIENCPAFDPNHTGTVTVEELVQAVNNALEGCPT